MQHADGEILAAQAAEDVRRALLPLHHVDLLDRGRGGEHHEALLVPALRDARPRLHREPDRPRQGRELLGAGADPRPADPRPAPQGPAQRPLRPAEVDPEARLAARDPAASGASTMLGTRRHGFGNIVGHAKNVGDLSSLASWTKEQFDPRLSWKDVEWIKEKWGGKLILKGILDPEDARMSLESGADAIIVSNHGGRQLDGARSSISALPGIVEAVGDRIEVHMDGGVRSGQDVLKARRARRQGHLDRPALPLRPRRRRQGRGDALPRDHPQRARHHHGALRPARHPRHRPGRPGSCRLRMNPGGAAVSGPVTGRRAARPARGGAGGRS